MREINFDGTVVNDQSDCYVIAEIGNNHQGDMEKAKALIKAAYDAGADAVKFQKRDNEALFTKNLYHAPYDNPNSYGSTYGEHRNFLELNIDQFKDLQAFSNQLGITFFATPFDFPSSSQLAEMDLPVYKMASADLRNIPFLKHVASFGKPIIISTGGATLEDVERAYDAIMPINKQLCILQCTAAYPCEFEDLNLRVIETYREQFPDVVIGLSSHANGIAMGPVAYMLGARVIEKHFTVNRAWKGTDQCFSLEKTGLEKLVRDLKRTRVALGDGTKRMLECESKPMHKMRKKIVVTRDLPAGHVLCPDDICFKCPGDGLSPYEINDVLGRKLSKSLQMDEKVEYEILVD